MGLEQEACGRWGGQQSTWPIGQGSGGAIGSEMRTAPGIKGSLSLQESDLTIPGERPLGTGFACSPTGIGHWTGIEDGQRQWIIATENTDLREEAIIDRASLSEVFAACFSSSFK